MTHVSPVPEASIHRDGAWLPLTSGRRWWPLTPRVADVCWRDIADGLGKTARFAGHTQAAPYSLAQHCCHVASLLPPELRLYGLVHDAHEAVMGLDWPTPLKNGAPAPVRDWLARVEQRNRAVIHQAAGLSAPSGPTLAALRHADQTALATEQRDLMAPCDAPLTLTLPEPDTTTVLRPEPWHQAADRWLSTLRTLLPANAPVRM